MGAHTLALYAVISHIMHILICTYGITWLQPQAPHSQFHSRSMNSFQPMTIWGLGYQVAHIFFPWLSSWSLCLGDWSSYLPIHYSLCLCVLRLLAFQSQLYSTEWLACEEFAVASVQLFGEWAWEVNFLSSLLTEQFLGGGKSLHPSTRSKAEWATGL